MEEKLFSCASKIIKILAKINFYLSFIIGIIGGIVFLVSLGDDTTILAVIVLAATIGGIIVLLISSVLIYGFAEIVENAEKSIELNSILKKDISLFEQANQNNKTQDNKNKVNYAIKNSNTDSTKQINYDIPEI